MLQTPFGNINILAYHIHAPVNEVPHGIAWVVDYEGYRDVRTWFAADPKQKEEDTR